MRSFFNLRRRVAVVFVEAKIKIYNEYKLKGNRLGKLAELKAKNDVEFKGTCKLGMQIRRFSTHNFGRK